MAKLSLRSTLTIGYVMLIFLWVPCLGLPWPPKFTYLRTYTAHCTCFPPLFAEPSETDSYETSFLVGDMNCSCSIKIQTKTPILHRNHHLCKIIQTAPKISDDFKIPRDPSSPSMVSWNLNTLRFGDDCTSLAHPLTFGDWIPRESYG